MELIRGLHNLRPRHVGSVVTLGAFDGVHLGHQALLRQLIDKGRELGLPTVVVVFEPLPREYFAPLDAPPRLMSFREKFLALREFGIDRVLRINFNDAFRQMSATQFAEQVFVEGLGSRCIIVGDDSHFGRNRDGDLQLLEEIGSRRGFEVVPTDTLNVDAERVSSTRIREALAQADFTLAEALLGRPYSIAGRVMQGQQLGRQLGVPTANLKLDRIRAPLSGVYAVEAEINGHRFPGVANVGTRPTIGDLVKAILEVHLLDFSDNIYGRNIRVIFRQKIRDEQKFDSLELLKAQINRDIKAGRQFFA